MLSHGRREGSELRVARSTADTSVCCGARNVAGLAEVNRWRIMWSVRSSTRDTAGSLCGPIQKITRVLQLQVHPFIHPRPRRRSLHLFDHPQCFREYLYPPVAMSPPMAAPKVGSAKDNQKESTAARLVGAGTIASKFMQWKSSRRHLTT